MHKAKFVLYKAKVIGKYNEMKKLGDIVSYSYKTNVEVGKILEKETDCMISVHSIASLEQLDYHDRVWYFAQAWNNEEIKNLIKKGVNNFVVDNQKDLNVLLKSGVKFNLLLRMRLKEHTIHTGKHYVYGFYSNKINELIPKLKKNKLIGKLGIHFHRKTQNISEWDLKSELQDTIECWDDIDFVNIGGGIPAEYKNFRSSVLKNIFDQIKELRLWLNNKNIKMIIEPGRYIAAYSINLEANILNVYDNNIVIDCSVYNAAMDTFVANIRLLVKGELDQGEAYTIKGCTPDSMDIFRYKVFLKNPKIGDKLIFLNAGAYNYASDFCNLPKLETVIRP